MVEDAEGLLAEAEELLLTDPVAHAPLISEAAFLAHHPSAASFGVWRDAAGSVAAAFLRAPGHPALLTRPLPAAALDDVVVELPWEIDATDLDRVHEAFARRHVALREASRIRVHRLRPGAVPDPASIDAQGRARTAAMSDRPLLAAWYGRLLGGLDDDPTDLAYLVDEPLSHGGAMLWERDGEPVGATVATRPVLGVTKVTAAWSPDDRRYADAAFAAACAAARRRARTVVAVDRPGADDAPLRSLGFEVVAERVLLDADPAG